MSIAIVMFCFIFCIQAIFNKTEDGCDTNPFS